MLWSYNFVYISKSTNYIIWERPMLMKHLVQVLASSQKVGFKVELILKGTKIWNEDTEYQSNNILFWSIQTNNVQV